MSKSGFYAWLNRPVSAHDAYDQRLKDAMKKIHKGFKRAYGAARLHQELLRKGYACSRRRVRRLMQELGLKASTVGLYAWRPGLHELYSCTGNQLGKEEKPTQCGTQWVGDFTYIKTGKGWLYHAVVLDLFSRKVIGWSFALKRGKDMTMSALKMALARETPENGCIFHSDQGIEYAAHDYRRLVESNGLKRSMSRKGNPLDNSAMESFFHSMKAELIHQSSFDEPIEAVAHIIEYIEFYNRERLHSSLSYQSPMEYEKLYV